MHIQDSATTNVMSRGRLSDFGFAHACKPYVCEVGLDAVTLLVAPFWHPEGDNKLSPSRHRDKWMRGPCCE